LRVLPYGGELSRPDGIFVRSAFQIHRVADGRRFAGSQIDLAALDKASRRYARQFAVLDWDEARKSVSANPGADDAVL